MTIKYLLSVLILLILSSCASYTTPGGGVQLSSLSDKDINEIMAQKPAARLPVNLAIARVQAPDYKNYHLSSFGTGRYSVVTTREVESEDDFKQIAALPGISAVAPLNKILLPTRLDSIKALRQASARLKADILLIYSFDTSCHAGEQ